MSTHLIFALLLLIVILCGIFAYRVNAAYHSAGSIITAIASILLFLMAIHAIPL